MNWPRGKMYKEICKMYVDLIKTKYSCTVVFDGYASGPSTKDNTHLRRSKGNIGNRVKEAPAMKINAKKDDILLHKSNKQDFIDLLAVELEKEGIATLKAEADADALIAKTAISMSSSVNTVVIAEDTDVLFLLCYYHSDECTNKLIMRSDRKGNKTMCGISQLTRDLGQDICQNILFIHAFLGRDTTSRPFGNGKASILRMLNSSETLQHAASIFNSVTSSK